MAKNRAFSMVYLNMWLCCCFSSCCHFLFLHLGVCLFRLLSIFLLFFLLNALYQLHSSCHRFKPSFTLKLALVSHGLIYFLFYLLIFLIRLLLPYYFEIWRGGVGGKLLVSGKCGFHFFLWEILLLCTESTIFPFPSLVGTMLLRPCSYHSCFAFCT